MIILAFSMILLAVMVLGSLYLFLRIGGTAVRGLFNWSRPTPRRRVGGFLLASAVILLLGYFWTPYIYLITRSAPAGVQTFEISSRNHVEGPVSYQQNPPVGGDHAPVVQNCGYYDTPVAPENVVHSMEHGAVWITYRPEGLSNNQIQELRQMAYRQGYIIVSPKPDQSTPIVATAWGRQLSLASANDIKLDQFVRAYRLSADAPESGGLCTGGIGEPK